MLPKRGNNFFDACDFKGLGAVKCGPRMTFSNLRAMNDEPLDSRETHHGANLFYGVQPTQRCSTERVLNCWSRLSQRPVIGAARHTNLRRCRRSVPNYWCIHDHDHACGKPPRQRAIAQRFCHGPKLPRTHPMVADFRAAQEHRGPNAGLRPAYARRNAPPRECHDGKLGSRWRMRHCRVLCDDG